MLAVIYILQLNKCAIIVHLKYDNLLLYVRNNFIDYVQVELPK